jgi:hypothetical protein
MKNHRKKNLMSIFTICFCEMRERKPVFLNMKVHFETSRKLIYNLHERLSAILIGLSLVINIQPLSGKTHAWEAH